LGARAINDLVKFKIKTVYELETICCMGLRSHYRGIWLYLKIAPEIRKKLEQIPEKQKWH